MSDIGLRSDPSSGFGGFGYMSPSPTSSTPLGVTQSFGQQLGNSLKSGLQGFVSGLPGGLMSAGLSALGSVLQYNMQKKLMDKSIKANTDQWKAENAYNDPSAQMQRMMAAGLNPNLVAGSAATGNASQMTPSSNVPTASNPMSNFASVQGAIKSLQSFDADIRLKNAQAAELESRAGKETAEMETQRDAWTPYIKQLFHNAGLQSDNIQLAAMQISKNIELTNTNLRNLDRYGYGLFLDNFKKEIENKYFEDYLLSVINSNNGSAARSYSEESWNRQLVQAYKRYLIGAANQSQAQADFTSGPLSRKTNMDYALGQERFLAGLAEASIGFFAAQHDGFSFNADANGKVHWSYKDTGRPTQFDIQFRSQRIRNAQMITDATCEVVNTAINAVGAVYTGGASTILTSYKQAPDGKMLPVMQQKVPMSSGTKIRDPFRSTSFNPQYFGKVYSPWHF